MMLLPSRTTTEETGTASIAASCEFSTLPATDHARQALRDLQAAGPGRACCPCQWLHASQHGTRAAGGCLLHATYRMADM